MTEFGDFFRDRSIGERVIGTFLWPYRYFGLWMPPFDPWEATEVCATAVVDATQVLVTRTGGVFTRPPLELHDPYRDLRKHLVVI